MGRYKHIRWQNNVADELKFNPSIIYGENVFNLVLIIIIILIRFSSFTINSVSSNYVNYFTLKFHRQVL